MNAYRKIIASISVCTLLLSLLMLESCGDDSPIVMNPVDNYDRPAMLSNWADNIIIPAYEDYLIQLNTLVTAVQQFNEETTLEKLQELQSKWLVAYKSWQRVALFDIGKAEEIGLRNFTNVYPVDVEGIEQNIKTNDFNLELPSSFDEQGFAAIDYLIHDIGLDNTLIVNRYDDVSGDAYRAYLERIINRLVGLTTIVLEDWKINYRNIFIQNAGSSATASVNKVINDYLFYYEKFLRAGKVGIPAGVFSSSVLPDRVEAYYAKEVSKDLFLVALDACQDFFNGVSFDGSLSAESLASYLDYLDEINDYTTDLSVLINNQFELARSAASNVDRNFASQVSTDNDKMLNLHDELKKNVILMKVDMLQVLNVKVDYVDADGD